MTIWLGPYLLEKFHENGYFHIITIDEEGIPSLINGYRLKLYRRPLSKEEFISLFIKELYVIWSFIASSPQHS